MGNVVGVDEVGRGCLAGPLLVVAARQIGDLPDGLRDSKLMTRKQREDMFDLLAPHKNPGRTVGNRIAERQVFVSGLGNCCEFAEGWVKAVEIDRYGLAQALRLGVKRALNGLKVEIGDEIIMDGKVNYIPKKFKKAQCIIDADNLVPIVSAASIYAKVTRDNFMIALARKHPNYGFENHVGYGTAEHKKALKTFGALKFVHRTSYTPISRLADTE